MVEAPGYPDAVRASIERVLAFMDAQIDDIERQLRDGIDEDPGLHSKRKLQRLVLIERAFGKCRLNFATLASSSVSGALSW